MATPSSRTPMAGGFLLSITILVGAIVGVAKGQPSLGVVVGAAIGVALAVLIWLRDRTRG